MTITKTTKKPIDKDIRIDRIEICTHYGSQSTDYFVCLYRGQSCVHVEDVRGIEEGIDWLAQLISRQPAHLGVLED